MPTLPTRTEATSLLATDLLYLARDPFGATDDRKILVSNLFNTTNLQLSSGKLNTIQDITTASTVQFARMGIGIAAETSAILSLSSTTLGFLQPRMTTVQRDAIATPAAGLSIYNTTSNDIQFYNGSSWISSAGVLSTTGTANQVLANGTSGSAQTGAVTLTLPQKIDTSANVIFTQLKIDTLIGKTSNLSISAANPGD